MKNQRGMTLIEVMTAVLAGAAVVVIIAGISWVVTSQFAQMRERFQAEEAAATAEVLLRSVFSQAISVEMADLAGGTDLTTNPGRIVANTDFNQMSVGADWTSIAVFLREVGSNMGTALNESVIQGTGIWYRKPTPTTSGVLFIDQGRAIPNPETLQPDFSDAYVDRISSFSIQKTAHPSSSRVASVEFAFRFRYHLNGQSTGPAVTYCPAQDLGAGTAGCDATLRWMDIERRFSVILRNNLLRSTSTTDLSATSGAVEERPLGNLYFFHPILPTRR